MQAPPTIHRVGVADVVDVTHHVGAVDVVHVSVLRAAEVLRVFVHGDLGPVEHRRLVHVVPRVEVERAAHVIVQQKLLGPVQANLGVDEIKPARRACQLISVMLQKSDTLHTNTRSG